MIVVDASVWVSAFLLRDKFHLDVAAFLRHLVEEGTPVCTPVLAMPEIAGAIGRQTNNSDLAKQTIAFLRGKPWIDFVPLSDDLAFEAAAIASRHRLRGADAVYVALAAKMGAPLITLDVEMLERSAGAAASLTPVLWLEQYRTE